jgi:hypothetical protein
MRRPVRTRPAGNERSDIVVERARHAEFDACGLAPVGSSRLAGSGTLETAAGPRRQGARREFPGLTRGTRWAKLDGLPRERPSRAGLVCVRSLRTQQRAEYCRCQIETPSTVGRRRAGRSIVMGSFGKTDDILCQPFLPGLFFSHVSMSPGPHRGAGMSDDLDGEFDPGSGRTLAACLTHASRAERPLRGHSSGERVSNTWVTCPWLRDNPGKPRLIPDTTRDRMVCV